jgi:hypothetical protein
MLEKTPGAVVCGHCHTLGADDLCGYCRGPVHRRCLESDRCPVPHPRELRLGMGWRLRDIDEEGRIGRVGHVLGGDQVRELASRTELVPIWPALRHNDLPVINLEPLAVGPSSDRLVRCAATYTLEESTDGTQQTIVYRDPLLALARVSANVVGGVEDLRYLERPSHDLADRLLVTRDGRTALLASASRFDIIDLEQRQPTRVVDLRGEMMFDLAVFGDMDLAVAAVFGRLRCFNLRNGQLRGSIPLEDQDVTAVAVGGAHVAAVTAELDLHVREVSAGPPDSWREALRTDVEARGKVTPGQLALSHDGRLVALRHRRKQVLVINLASGERQLLRGHTDTICFIRFIAGGRTLVTADDDNRVCFWPRSGDRLVSGE